MFEFLSRKPIHDATASLTASTEVKKTTCYMRGCRCGIRVHMREGVIRYIDRNPGPSHQQGGDLRQLVRAPA